MGTPSKACADSARCRHPHGVAPGSLVSMPLCKDFPNSI
jgi:hypothetical protein